MVITFILAAIAVIMIIAVIIIYNNLVQLKHNVSKNWSNIDILLKQRHDELPKLVDTCKEYMRHEEETLTKVIEARSQISNAREKNDIKGLGAAESMLRGGLGQLFAVVEQYPELKADQTFKHLQARISELEEAIADRRELYNDSVNLNNVRIEQFPDVMIASLFNFGAKELLVFEESEKADVDLGARFSKDRETVE